MADVLLLAFVCIAVFLAHFVSAISGGAGLIVRPLLIFAGLSAQVAIGTARIAGLGSRAAGLIQFHKHKKIDWKLALFLTLPSIIGGIIGAQFVASLDEELLKKLMGIAVIVFGALLFLQKNTGPHHRLHTLTVLQKMLGPLLVVLSGIVATIIGGEGILLGFVLIFLYKKTYITAAAIRKVASYGGAISSSVFLWYHSFVNWELAILLFIFGSLGDYFGVHFGIKKGEVWVRKVALLVIFIVGIKLLFF